MPTRQHKRGLTLVELLVVVAVGIILSVVSTSMLTHGMRGFARGSTRAELQQQALVASTRLLEDLTNCGPHALELAAEGLCVQAQADVNADSRPVYAAGLIVYARSPDRCLRRLEWTLPPETDAGSAYPCRGSDLDAILNLTRNTGRVLCPDLDHFTVERVQPGANLLIVSLALSRAVAGQGVLRYDWSSRVHLRQP